MPRTARIDIPGILQHIIVRGIEKCDIFLNDDDRDSFVRRFAGLLEQTGTDCLAWALMTNHFHLLLRTNQTKLSLFMRRLLTGHAVTFNLRHGRVGHLFQNRYKSIVCEKEPYLLELVRYIHLNPLRAGLLKDLGELDAYPWSGHAVLMGNGAHAGQQTDEVLSRFGRKSTKARRAYREFIADGIAQGRRPDLLGGGLRRSRPGKERESEAFDERVLGSGDFVDNIHREIGLAECSLKVMPLAELVERIAALYEITPQALSWRTRSGRTAEARSVLCFLSMREMGYTGVEVADVLHMSRAGVSVAATRGACLVRADPDIRQKLEAN